LNFFRISCFFLSLSGAFQVWPPEASFKQRSGSSGGERSQQAVFFQCPPTREPGKLSPPLNTQSKRYTKSDMTSQPTRKKQEPPKRSGGRPAAFMARQTPAAPLRRGLLFFRVGWPSSAVLRFPDVLTATRA